jgi:microcystin-dependent protein
MEGTLGEIRVFAGISNGNAFVPRGWRLCDGAILPINGNVALYSILGAIYGGDGIQTFALPDLRSRLPVGAGDAPDRPAYGLAQKAGTEQIATSSIRVVTDDLVASIDTVAPGPGNNVQPVLGLSYIICIEGAFPFPEGSR